MPTYQSGNQYHQWPTAHALIFVNNWLKEGLWQLRFGLFYEPLSVESPTTDKRFHYISYPPGAYLPVYFLLKFVQITGIVPDLVEKRGTQLMMLTAYNYFLHFVLTLVLCVAVFFLMRRMGFDRLNSTILAIIPAIIQFHNYSSLYWHHVFYNMEQAVLLPYLLFAFLEFLRVYYPSKNTNLVTNITQPAILFYGTLTDWIFVFFAVTVYFMRVMRREITLPQSLVTGLLFFKQSFLFFIPVLAAISLWLYQIFYFSSKGISKLLVKKIVGVGTELGQLGPFEKQTSILDRMGIGHSFDDYAHYLKTALFTHISSSYGIIGLLLIYIVLYMTTRGKKFMSAENQVGNPAVFFYLLFLVPQMLYLLFFVQHHWNHPQSVLKFSIPLCISFVIFPVLVLQMRRINHLCPAIELADKIKIYLVTVISLITSILFSYMQVYDKKNVTRFFNRPKYVYLHVGNFVRRNTEYQDVVFSKDFFAPLVPPQALSFSDKKIHFVWSLDQIYQKTKSITQNFTIKIFYIENNKQEAYNVDNFLTLQDVSVSRIEEEKLGGLIVFDGHKFIAWYEKIHECDTHPQRCAMKEG